MLARSWHRNTQQSRLLGSLEPVLRRCVEPLHDAAGLVAAYCPALAADQSLPVPKRRSACDWLSGSRAELHFCYEAGGCGYGIYRQLLQLDASCIVIAPSMMPKRPEDPIKNDRRDAVTLARLLRAGELTAVWVPDEDHEAMRDLVRARRQAKDDLVAARQMLLGFLLRHGRRFPGRSNWTKMHWRWLREQVFASPHQQFVFAECIRRIEEAQARCNWLDRALQEATESWSLAPLVKALQALRGVGLIVAATLVTEIGDLGRFTVCSA